MNPPPTSVIPRHWCDQVLSDESCDELIQIHNALCVAGYMSDFNVVTLGEFLSHRRLPYLVPLLRARNLMLEKVEEYFGLDFTLSHEFTALFGYEPGAFLLDHYDSTREYLKNRHYSAVLYLNNGGGQDFSGGDFVFRDKREDSDLTRVTSRKGGLLMFTSGPENVHCVEEVTSGSRFALNIFFTLNTDACEDRRYLAMIPEELSQPFSLPDGSQPPPEGLFGVALDWAKALARSSRKILGLEGQPLRQRSHGPEENANTKLLQKKLRDLQISPFTGFTLASEPLMVTLEEKTVPFLFETLTDAIDFGFFRIWKHKANPDLGIPELYSMWQSYRGSLTLELVSSLPRWKKLGLLSPSSPTPSLPAKETSKRKFAEDADSSEDDEDCGDEERLFQRPKCE